MACMEHICPNCTWRKMDNETYKNCPQCGYSVNSFFDEESDNVDIEMMQIENAF